jgi:hypothetical protein
MRVYVVETGLYSSKGVVGVFADETLANDWAAKLDQGQVTPFDLDAYKGRAEQGEVPFAVVFDSPGSSDADAYQQSPNDAEYYKSREPNTFWVWAKDREGALKIANERRAVWLATH